MRELALERAQVAEAGERVGVRLRLQLARARLRRAPPWPRPGSPPWPRPAARPPRRSATGRPRARRAARAASTAWSAATSRATSAARASRPPPRSAASDGRALRLLLRQVVAVAVALRDRADDAGDQLGQLAGDALGRQLADLVERSALDQTHEPLLGKLVARALEAREWSPDGCHWSRSYPRKRRTAGRISEKIALVSDLISIEEARRRVLEAVTRLGDEAVSLDAALGRVLAEEVTSPIDVPPFDSSAMDGYAVVAGPARRARRDRRGAGGAPGGGALCSGSGGRGSPPGRWCLRARMPWFPSSERRR